MVSDRMGSVKEFESFSKFSSGDYYVLAPNCCDLKEKQSLISQAVATYNLRWLENCISQCEFIKEDFVLWSPLPHSLPLAFMETLSISISGFEDRERENVNQLIKLSGAEASERFSKKQTHLICKTSANKKYELALKWKKSAIVSIEWLVNTVRKGYKCNEEEFFVSNGSKEAEEYFRAFYKQLQVPGPALVDLPKQVTEEDKLEKPKSLLPPLHGLNIYVSRTLKSSKKELQEQIVRLGAYFANVMDGSVTHFLFNGKGGNSKEVKQAEEFKLHFVSPNWLKACEREKLRMNEKDFPPVLNPKMSLTIQQVDHPMSQPHLTTPYKKVQPLAINEFVPFDFSQEKVQTPILNNEKLTPVQVINQNFANGRTPVPEKLPSGKLQSNSLEISKKALSPVMSPIRGTPFNALSPSRVVSPLPHSPANMNSVNIESNRVEASNGKLEHISSTNILQNPHGNTEARRLQEEEEKRRQELSQLRREEERKQEEEEKRKEEERRVADEKMKKELEELQGDLFEASHATALKKRSDSVTEDIKRRRRRSNHFKLADLVFKKRRLSSEVKSQESEEEKRPPASLPREENSMEVSADEDEVVYASQVVARPSETPPDVREPNSLATPAVRTLMSEIQRMQDTVDEKSPLHLTGSVNTIKRKSEALEKQRQANKGQFKFVLTRLSPSEKDRFRSVLQKLGASIVEEVDNSTTHVIMGSPGRSEKAFLAFAAGLWVLQKSFIFACEKALTFVDPTPFEWHSGVLDASASPSDRNFANAGKLCRLAYQKTRTQERPGICSDWKVVLYLSDGHKRFFKQVIELAGGTVVKTPANGKKMNGNAIKSVTHAFLEKPFYEDNQLAQLHNAEVLVLGRRFIEHYLIYGGSLRAFNVNDFKVAPVEQSK